MQNSQKIKIIPDSQICYTSYASLQCWGQKFIFYYHLCTFPEEFEQQ